MTGTTTGTHGPAAFLAEMQALAGSALARWDLTVTGLSPI
jgi:hypothetical protein